MKWSTSNARCESQKDSLCTTKEYPFKDENGVTHSISLNCTAGHVCEDLDIPGDTYAVGYCKIDSAAGGAAAMLTIPITLVALVLVALRFS